MIPGTATAVAAVVAAAAAAEWPVQNPGLDSAPSCHSLLA